MNRVHKKLITISNSDSILLYNLHMHSTPRHVGKERAHGAQTKLEEDLVKTLA